MFLVMVYFNFIYYFILGHVLLSFVYQAYIYYLYKAYDIRFKRQSVVLSLFRSEIKDNILNTVNDSSAHKGLQRLLVLHNILSITGKVIVIFIVFMIVVVIAMMK